MVDVIRTLPRTADACSLWISLTPVLPVCTHVSYMWRHYKSRDHARLSRKCCSMSWLRMSVWEVERTWAALPLLGNFPKILEIWESTWDLGNFPSNLGNSGISRKFREILVIPNLQQLTSVVFIRYLTACHSGIFCNHRRWTYLDSKLVCAALVQNGIIIISACKIIVPSLLLRYYSVFIGLGILRSTWEFLEHNLGNSRKVEW